MLMFLCIVFSILTVNSVLSSDTVFKQAERPRYEYILDEDGTPHLLDRWLKHSDLVQLPRYDPDRDNQYHLFTRENPTVSQPIVWGNIDVLRQSNFDPGKKTTVVIHGYGGSVTTSSNSVLIPAFLAAADVNVIAVDWSVGAVAPTLAGAFHNVMLSGRSAAGFLNWLLSATGQTASDLHINGFSLGGHHAGITGRYVNGNVSFVTALDPTRSEGSEHEFRADDGAYTEVINTNVNAMGYRPLGQVDFYPNGGQDMPGCGPGDVSCNHSRAYFFIAESLRSGGFTGRQCESYQHAQNGTCNLPGLLQMGGLTPKTGKMLQVWDHL